MTREASSLALRLLEERRGFWQKLNQFLPHIVCESGNGNKTYVENIYIFYILLHML